MVAVLFPEADILKILTGRKAATCRGYSIPAGATLQLMAGFKVFAVAKVTAVSYIPDISRIDNKTVRKLGFKTRKAYLNESYNKNNESKERYLIEFEIVNNEIINYINKWW